ncbi:MAG: ABC transporter permease subunit [Candidatus Latescibacterota bacterium]
MIRLIFARELLDMVSSWRFATFSAMLVAMGLTITSVRAVEHQRRLQEYAQAQNLQDQVLDAGMSPGSGGGLVFSPPRRPARMSLVAQGTQESLMERFLVSVYENPIEVLFCAPDLLQVMGIVISLGALLLASDQLCGERETGTLRLTMANPVKRSSILLGKWLACLATLGTGVLLLFLAVAAVLVLLQPDAWTATDWASFAVLFLLTLAYASAFLLIGLFLSATTRHSGTAAVGAMMVWAIIVFVLPSLPLYLAREVAPALSPTYATIHSLRAEDKRRAKLQALRAPLHARGLSDVEVEQQLDSVAVRRIWEEYHEERNLYENGAHERAGVQVLIGAALDQVSPYSAYLLGGAEVTGVGLAALASHLNFGKKQEMALSEFLEEKWRAEAKRNPRLREGDVLDTRDRPRLVYEGDPLVYRLAGLAIPLLTLVAFNGVFFMLAWRRFMRYDVR